MPNAIKFGPVAFASAGGSGVASRFVIDHFGEMWAQKEGVFVRGYAFTSAGEFLNAAALCQLAHGKKERLEELALEVGTFNGSFAILVLGENSSFAAVDRLRSIPLFYAEVEGQLIFSDGADRLRELFANSERSHIAEVEFVAVGYVTGDATLYPNVKQLQAGQYLFARRGGEVELRYYYRHFHKDFDRRPREELFRTLRSIDERIAKRLLRSTEGCSLLIPLSGGYDSRYIACLLKRYAPASVQVRCYTYGRPDSAEVLRAKRVAEQLGFPIEFIEYSGEKWEAFFHSEDARKFFRVASSGAASPHIQDYIALAELRKRGMLDSKTVVVPGFCGDVLGGSFIPEPIVRGNSEALLRDGLPQFLYDRFFAPMMSTLYPGDRNEILQRLERSLESEAEQSVLTEEEFVSAVDEWVTRHRLGRFIINAVRVYEHFGLQWRMPLWDNELVEFWYRIPFQFRRKNALYNDYLFQSHFGPLNIAYRRPMDRAFNRMVLALSERSPAIYRMVRKCVRVLRGKTSEVQGFNGFDVLAEILKRELAKDGIALDSPDINHYFARWLLLDPERA